MSEPADYARDMSAEAVQARDVAAAIRRRLPGVGAEKLHKLLYYAQGHHLAAFDRPLFTQSISAWDMGPVVAALWHEEQTGPEQQTGHVEKTEAAPPATADLDQAALNTVGYVVSRYGRLTGRDLEVLSHGEPPWLEANARRQANAEASERIAPGIMAAYFASDTDEDDLPLDEAEVAALVAGAAQRIQNEPGVPDDLDALRHRVSNWRRPA